VPVVGGVGGGHCEGVVGEVGDEVEAPAEGLDVAGDGLDGGQFAALDLGDSARGNTYDLGELSMTRSGHDPDPIVRVFSPNRYTKNGGAKGRPAGFEPATRC
jgi:hypothetical protein